MKYIPIVIAFALGMAGMWNFMRTAYAYPDISRWFYAGDGVIAAACLVIAIAIAAEHTEPTP